MTSHLCLEVNLLFHGSPTSWKKILMNKYSKRNANPGTHSTTIMDTLLMNNEASDGVSSSARTNLDEEEEKQPVERDRE